MSQGKFIHPDGTRISENVVYDITTLHVHWVSLDFRSHRARVFRIRSGGSAGLMRIMAEQIRLGVVCITDKPLHHDEPAYISLPVVGERDLPHVQIMENAAIIADWHHDEIFAGREILDVTGVYGALGIKYP